MYTNIKKKVTGKFKSGGLHEKHVVATWKLLILLLSIRTPQFKGFKTYASIYVAKHTECPRRNVPNFGRVFLMLNYADVTQNTYVQSWTVTEIKAREKCGLFAVPRTVLGSRDVIPIRCALSVLVYSWLKHVPRCDYTCKVLGNLKDNCDVSASVFVFQFNEWLYVTHKLVWC